MSNNGKETIRLRSLLTDTLPYEVPVIFSNDKFYAGLAAAVDDTLRPWLERARPGLGQYTVPYNYEIWKDDERSASLSIIHPLAQLKFVDFYELHSASILNFCANGGFSLRRPIALASPFAEGKIENDEARLRIGVVQTLADAGEPDVSHLSSYFAYGKYNLLRKFIGSREFLRLETKYLLYRSLDISKCFYNIYTHSISWAVKDKEFSKENKGAYSFESEFDGLMQKCNYNETNGIVVGPEFSRIFAEIILQAVDVEVERELHERRGKTAGRHYDIRRYVDDYFVFANTSEELDKIESVLRSKLSAYKLYINDKKIETFRRPFVSELTLARQEVATLMSSITNLVWKMGKEPEEALTSRNIRSMGGQIQSLRFVVAKFGLSFANISGWLMSRLKRLARICLRYAKSFVSASHKESILDVVISILEAAFYICGLDLRVRTTYSICQLAHLIREAESLFSPEQQDLIRHIIMDRSGSILRSIQTRLEGELGERDSVEAYNLLICGAEFVGADFVKSNTVGEVLEEVRRSKELSYFAFVALKFCYLKDSAFFARPLAELNKLAEDRIRSNKHKINQDTETYLLFSDFIASPDITSNVKRELFNFLFGGQISNDLIERLGSYLGFVDWSGLSVEHMLRRKELRPVYEWG